LSLLKSGSKDLAKNSFVQVCRFARIYRVFSSAAVVKNFGCFRVVLSETINRVGIRRIIENTPQSEKESRLQTGGLNVPK
jgi:hypothetical protein